ncbi:MAG: hypothetical protein E7012_06085 [Alphaproteobacteria bacterium]|nr:hypothetical protein [Alphaproteobacteria bacterium]
MTKLLLILLVFLLITILSVVLIQSIKNSLMSCKHKKEQAKFQKQRAEENERIQLLGKQTISKHLYGYIEAPYFANCMVSGIHLFNNQRTPVLRPNGYPFTAPENFKLLLSAVHPDCKFPSNGYPLNIDKTDYNERTQIYKAWFAPCNAPIIGFVVQKVSDNNVYLLHGSFGTLILPKSQRRSFRKGDKVKVMQSSILTDSGYKVTYYIV